MGRAQYESDASRRNERVVARFYLNQYKKRNNYTNFRKLPAVSYGVDYVFVEGDTIKCWAEVKCRNWPFEGTREGTLVLSVLKWKCGQNHARATGLPFRVIVRFREGIVGCYEFEQDHVKEFKYEWGGRTVDTRDEGDLEPVVHIPYKYFKIVGTLASLTEDPPKDPEA